MDSEPYLLLLTTCDRREPLEAIARQLVEAKHAVCVQIGGPVSSIYRWQGNLEQASEWQLAAKVVRHQQAAAASLILAAHPYDVPELIALPFMVLNVDYANWLKDSSAE
jgi:periplasmic divalent cation tolerance protein